MKTTKLTVLENVSSLDAPLVNYLKQLKNTEVTTVYSIQHNRPEKQKEVHQALSSCDVLCVCSSFANETQLAEFVKLLPNYPNIKEVRLLYLYSKPGPGDDRALLFKLNLEVQKDVYRGVVSLLSKVKVVEVFHVALVTQKQTYFNKEQYYFDEVELYYNAKQDLLWHVRPPYIVLDGDNFYLEHTTKTVTKTVTETVKGLHVKVEDVPTFKEMLQEFRAVVENQKESCELHDFGDSVTLIAEKTKWLELLDKYKL